MIKSKLSVIIPAFNEEEAIVLTLQRLIPVAEKNNWIILVINDGSTDKTASKLNGLNGITIYDHPYNKGYGAALKTGIRKAETELIALFDADGQHRVEDLEKLYNSIGSFDMLIGERGKDSHSDWIRKPGKWVLSKTANFLAGRKIPDLNSGLRVIRKEIIIKMLHLFPDGFSFSTTSTIAFYNMGYNVGYCPIKVHKRTGRSSVKQVRHGSQALLLILRLIILFNPLKVFIPVSFIIFIIGFLYELLYGIVFNPGFQLLPAALLTFITSILIFFFGLVVDQVSEMRKFQNER